MALVRRLLRCDDCGFQFTLFQDKTDDLPECPECAGIEVDHDRERERAEGEARIAAMVESGIPPGVQSHRSRALKEAESMMGDYGFTDMSDSGKQGDRAAKAPPPMQSREIQEMTHAMVEAKQMSDQEASNFAEGARTFWQHTPKTQMPKQLQKHIAAGPGAAAEARRHGLDPIELFHEAGKKGHLRRRPQVVAAVKG